MTAPKCISIIICEGVVEDVRTHNKCILNTFNSISAANFPVVHDRFTVFASLTDGRGQQRLSLRIVKDDVEQKEVLTLQGDIQFPDPLKVVDVTMDIRGITFPAPGNYFIEFLIGRETVGHRVFAVLKAQPAAPPNG